MADLVAQTQRIATALAEYAHRHQHEPRLQRPTSVLAYSSEYVLPTGQRRHVGGYADRLKGLLSTALLAMLCDRRFVAEWQTPHPISHALAPQALMWEMPLDVQTFARASHTLIDGIDDAAHARFRTKLLALHDVYDRLHGHEHLIRIHSNIDFLGDLLANRALLARTRLGRLLDAMVAGSASETVATWLFGALFRFLFRYMPQGVFQDTWMRFLEIRQQRIVVGVQFRTGGAGHWIDPELDGLASAERVAAAAVSAAQARGFDDPVFFVSTDHEGASAALGTALQPRNEVLRFGFPPAHFERSINADVGLQVDAPLLEHMCLAHCDLVVHGRGGFGTTAAMLGGVPAVPYAAFQATGMTALTGKSIYTGTDTALFSSSTPT